jgi:hypothetical protein
MAATRSKYRPWEIAPGDVFATIERLCAGQGRRTKKGDKRPRWEVERMKASRRRNTKERMVAAAEARRGAQLEAFRRRTWPAFPIHARMLMAMDPGKWYARSDLVRAAGVERNARGKVNQQLLARGMVERRRNPAYRGFERRGGHLPVKEPEWLYRLTEAGQMQRELWTMLT